ncbi:hypothetical protein Q4S03_19085, partial [Morganella morganii]
MPLLHELVYTLRYIPNFPYPAAPVLARHEPFHASALKAPPKAGRRGGESIAHFPANDFNCNLYQWREPDIQVK